MLVADLLGGNEIKGFENGVVIVNGKELDCGYYELIQICGNIPLGSVNEDRYLEARNRQYSNLTCEYLDTFYNVDFINENMLMRHVAYSSYELDIENKTLVLKIDAFD